MQPQTTLLPLSDKEQRDRDEIIKWIQGAATLISSVAFLVRETREAGRMIQRQRKVAEKRKQMETKTLYRPVGPREWELIAESGCREFPPRLPEQPIFYPVLNEGYATQIARDWNVRASGAGYVTRFQVRADFLAHYEIKVVGASEHQEYWILAEDLPAFNSAIVGPIEKIAEFHKEEPTDDLTGG